MITPVKNTFCILLVLLVSSFSNVSKAQTITADITGITDPASYYFNAENITYTSGGTGEAFGGSGLMICIEIGIAGPSDTQVSYNVVNAGALWDEAGGASRGEDYFHWIFDNHFQRLTDPTSPDFVYGRTRSNFEQSLYELIFDYDGTLSSLDSVNGQIVGTSSGRVEYRDILNDIIAFDASIAAGYRSSLYDLTFLENLGDVVGGAASQNMVLVNPIPVPEPSSALLVGLFGILGILRRSRRI